MRDVGLFEKSCFDSLFVYSCYEMTYLDKCYSRPAVPVTQKYRSVMSKIQILGSKYRLLCICLIKRAMYLYYAKKTPLNALVAHMPIIYKVDHTKNFTKYF